PRDLQRRRRGHPGRVPQAQRVPALERIREVAMREHLLSWQYQGYPRAHAERGNLLIHAATQPLFLAGTLALVLAPLASLWLAPAGLALMGGAIAAQGRGHKREENAPVPFEGPVDFATRLFVEQWVTFPRYVLSGGFGRAWRATRQPSSAPPSGPAPSASRRTP